MDKWISQVILLLLALVLLSVPSIHASHHTANGGVGGRILLGFKEKPRGSNLTFDCSPSGACVPCLYSEKNDERYRCSETGYRIPLKCVEIKDGTKNGNENKSQNSRSAIEISNENTNPYATLHDTVPNKHRSLLDDLSTLEDGSQVYITYRSCIIPANEEKLSVVGFENVNIDARALNHGGQGAVLGLFLISGSIVYIRRKQILIMSGVGGGRIQMNSRF